MQRAVVRNPGRTGRRLGLSPRRRDRSWAHVTGEFAKSRLRGGPAQEIHDEFERRELGHSGGGWPCRSIKEEVLGGRQPHGYDAAKWAHERRDTRTRRPADP